MRKVCGAEEYRKIQNTLCGKANNQKMKYTSLEPTTNPGSQNSGAVSEKSITSKHDENVEARSERSVKRPQIKEDTMRYSERKNESDFILPNKQEEKKEILTDKPLNSHFFQSQQKNNVIVNNLPQASSINSQSGDIFGDLKNILTDKGKKINDLPIAPSIYSLQNTPHKGKVDQSMKGSNTEVKNKNQRCDTITEESTVPNSKTELKNQFLEDKQI